jgi:hypothetical protein
MFFNNPIANFAQPRVTSGGGYARNVVTQDLFLYLDASDAASWPGSGTTWYDLTANAFNFTLYNTWSSGGTGTNKYLTSNGSGNYAQNTSSTLAALGLQTEFTVQCILERTSGANDQDYYSTNGIGGAASTLFMSYANQMRSHLWTASGTLVQDSGTAFGSAKKSFTARFGWDVGAGGTRNEVFNSTQVQTANMVGGTQPSSTSYTATNLCSRDGSGAYFGGYWYGVLVYTRYLDISEITQNVTAFGL